MKNIFLFFSFFMLISSSYGQESKKSFLVPYKIGILYNYGNEKNFLFDDSDYYYTTNTLKGQLFYKLGTWQKLHFELIAQPQIQFLKHQLLNKFYVTPDLDNFLEKQDRFTKLKSMRLYGLDFGLTAKREISKRLDIQLTASLGFSYIDTDTERLAKGFTFIENFSLGFNYKTSTRTTVYLGSNFGHVSNLNFQLPNDGYNILGVEIGFSYLLE